MTANRNKKRLYLGGLISPRIPACMEWRRQATTLLQDYFEVVDPSCNELDRWHKEGKIDNDELWSKSQGVFLYKDHGLVKSCDILLMNYTVVDPDRPMVGTIAETAWGFDWRKTIIGITNDNVYSWHPFVKRALAAEFSTVDEACRVIYLLYV